MLEITGHIFVHGKSIDENPGTTFAQEVTEKY
jgi:hypothetical protein